MDNDTRKPKKEKQQSNDTCRYLISLFLNSKHSLKYTELTGNYCSILRYLYDLMDNHYKSFKIKSCELSQKQIAIYARCSLRTVSTAIKYFIKKRMVIVKAGKGSENIYSPGKLCTGYATRLGRVRNEIKNIRNGCVPSNSFSNSFSNNKENSENKSSKTEPKQTAKFWEPGNPDYDRQH
jgi:hypothetical protein